MKKGICENCNRGVDVTLTLGKHLCSDCLSEIVIDQEIKLNNLNPKLADLDLYANKCHKQALNSGFYDKELNILDKYEFTKDERETILNMSVSQKLLLVISEIIEKLEAMRNGKVPELAIFQKFNLESDNDFYGAYQEHIKDSDFAEMAGVFIRLFDLAGYLKISLNDFVGWEMRYNSLRCKDQGKMHGKKF